VQSSRKAEENSLIEIISVYFFASSTEVLISRNTSAILLRISIENRSKLRSFELMSTLTPSTSNSIVSEILKQRYAILFLSFLSSFLARARYQSSADINLRTRFCPTSDAQEFPS
jgi:hypothetical protein